MPSLNTKLATAPNTTSNYVLRATSSTTIGNSTIQDDGTNVAIGTTPGTYKLNVSGTGNFTGALTGTSATFSGLVSVLSTSYDSGAEGLKLGYDSSYYNAISATFSSAAASNKMNFVVSSGNGTRGIAMTLQGNGNVGIGTSTIVANDGTSKTFQMGTRLAIQNVVGTQFLLSSNLYYDGAWKYMVAGKGQAIRGTGESGTIQFSLSPTGTAGGSVPNMDGSDVKMIILESGNVGIGTSTIPNQNGGTLAGSTIVNGIMRIQGTNGRYFTSGDGMEISKGSIYSYNRDSGFYNDIAINDAMIVKGGTNVLIGTSTDNGDRVNISGAVSISSNLGVGRGSESGVRLSISAAGTSSAAYSIINRDSSGNDLFVVRNDGYMLTGSRSLSPYNNTNGNVANMVVGSDGTLYRSTVSSLRFKENINDWIGSGLDTILALKPRTFNYKESYYKYPEVEMLGLIAEEVAEVCPYLAEFENQDRTGQVENVKYATIVVPLIKAIQEMNQTIQNQQQQINSLINR